MDVKRVAIIGAGVSGLPTIKHCLEEGLEPVCLKMRSDLGGLWNYTDKVAEGWSSCMRSTVTNTTKVFLSIRRGAWVWARTGPGGTPTDLFYMRRVVGALFSVLHSSLSHLIMVGLLSLQCSHELLGLEPKHDVLTQKYLINDELPSIILSGKIQIKGEIRKLTEDSAVFEDGSRENTDMVISATGYGLGFPFVNHDAFEGKEVPQNLYKFVFPPEVTPPTIAAIGYVQTQGLILAAAELHSRWAVRVFKAKVKLPSKEEMLKLISRSKNSLIHSTNGNPAFPWTEHLDDVADEVGCRPNILKLWLSDPVLAWHLFFGSILPSHYRLVGPGAWSGARRTILTVQRRITAPHRSIKVVHGNWRTVRFMLFILMIILFISFWFFC